MGPLSSACCCLRAPVRFSFQWLIERILIEYEDYCIQFLLINIACILLYIIMIHMNYYRWNEFSNQPIHEYFMYKVSYSCEPMLLKTCDILA
jgi:hypothetical protein